MNTRARLGVNAGVDVSVRAAESTPPGSISVNQAGIPAVEASTATSAPAPVGGEGDAIDARAPVRAAAGAGESYATRVYADIDGRALGLGGLLSSGVEVDGEIAALGWLTPLALDPIDARSTRVLSDASVDVRASLAHEAMPSAGGSTELVVEVLGARTPSARVSPPRVHLVIDASTSMERAWPELLRAARQVVAGLAPDVELHVVVYSDRARDAYGPAVVGDGRAARVVIDALRPSGGTNIEAGLRAAFGAVRPSSSLVVLLSDGTPIGGMSDPAELGALVEAERVASGTVTTVFGLGMDFDTHILASIAAGGAGRVHINRDPTALGEEIRREVALYADVAARDVVVEVALSQGVAAADGGRAISLRLPRLGVGEHRRFVFTLSVSAGFDGGSVAHVEATHAGARAAGAKDLELAVSSSPQPVGARAGALAALDVHLGIQTRLAGEALKRGDVGGSVAALMEHVVRAREATSMIDDGSLALRTRRVEGLARAIDALGARAEDAERRRVGVAMVALGLSLSAR